MAVKFALPVLDSRRNALFHKFENLVLTCTNNILLSQYVEVKDAQTNWICLVERSVLDLRHVPAHVVKLMRVR